MSDAGRSLELVVEFSVPGRAASRGSKRAFRTKSGRINLVDNKRSYEYMDAIKKCARAAMAGRPAVDGPVLLEWSAYFARPKCHYRKAGLKPDAPIYYTQTPDCSKIVRAIEDAMTGVVYGDDKQIVGYLPELNKHWCEGEPWTLIKVWKLR